MWKIYLNRSRTPLLCNAWLAFTPILPATACHQRHYLETDSRYREGRRQVPCSLIRTPYPHDPGQLRMLVHAHLDRAIKDERFRTFCRLQRFQQWDGPDLAPVCQPDSELTPPAPRHNMPVHQLTVFRPCARHLPTPPVSSPLTSPPAVGLPGWSIA